MIILKITPRAGCTIPVTNKTIYVTEEQLLRIGFSEIDIRRITVDWDTNSIKHQDRNFRYEASPSYSEMNLSQSQKNNFRSVKIVNINTSKYLNESKRIMSKYPDRIPVIVNKSDRSNIKDIDIQYKLDKK